MNVRTTDRALTSSPRDLARTAAPRHLHPPVQAVILAAGMGTRLGRSTPKPLTPLRDGRTIQRRQLDALRDAFGADTDITVVVGFSSDLLMTASPDVRFAYNPHYASTNTSKSLWRGLSNCRDGGVLWMNGDVVFDPAVLEHALELIRADQSFVCVDTNVVGDEEVKYTLDGDGFIHELSKTVVGGLGEAVGINYVSGADKAALIAHLERCADGDYFERGIETAIQDQGLRVRPLDISEFSAVEVDFEADLQRANTLLPGTALLLGLDDEVAAGA
jgi:choline kinase